MTNNSRSQQSATIIPFPLHHRAATIPQQSQQEMDCEELRWQLEWERRNIQD
jgi:hypothetical protein